MNTSKTVLPTYSLLGHRFDVSASLVRFSVTHSRFLLFFGILIAILTLFDTHHYGEMLSIWKVALVWTLSVTLVVVFYVSSLSVLIWAKHFVRGLVAYMPLVGAFSIVLSSYLTIQFAYFLSHIPAPPGIFWEHLPFNIAAVLVFDTLFFAYVAPILQRAEAESRRERPNVYRKVAIGKDEIPVSEILYMRAQDHYVNLYLRDGKTLMPRARMRDLVRQFKPEEGALVHRSYWVGWTNVVNYETTHEAQSLTMSNGAKVPVAKGRKAEVEQGLRAYTGGMCGGGHEQSA